MVVLVGDAVAGRGGVALLLALSRFLSQAAAAGVHIAVVL